MRRGRPLQETDFLRDQFGIEGDEISLKRIRIINERAKSGKCPAETEGGVNTALRRYGAQGRQRRQVGDLQRLRLAER